MAFVALLDASVLHPWIVCELPLRLTERGLYRPAWSTEILEELAAMAASTSRPALTAAQVLESLRRFAPEFVGLVERASSSGPDPTG